MKRVFPALLSENANLFRLARLFCIFLLLQAVSACTFIGYRGGSFQSSQPQYHVVKSGETVMSIARLYRVSAKQIAMLNRIHDINRLRIGERLLVGYRLQIREESSRAVVPPTGTAAVQAQTRQTQTRSTPGRLGWPVRGQSRVVSKFGPRGSSFHDGLDIAAKTGTPVLAAHDGVVIHSGNRLKGYGNLLIVRDQFSSMVTVYAHNRRLLTREGQRVKKGQQIGEVGSTGDATGPHLHFEVRAKDNQGRFVAVDPVPLLDGVASYKPTFRVNESLAPFMGH